MHTQACDTAPLLFKRLFCNFESDLITVTSLAPIGQFKTIHSPKMLLVVRYQRQVVGQRGGCNDEVEIIERGPLGFQLRLYHSKGLTDEKIHRNRIESLFDMPYFNQICSLFQGLKCPVIQLHKRDDTDLERVMLMVFQVSNHTIVAFKAVDDRIGVEQKH